MVNGRGKRPTPQDDLGYLSEESEFYGDEATIQELKDRSSTFDTVEWWHNKTPSLTEIANSNMAAAMNKKEAPLYNPYEGASCGRQLGETVEEFLARLPPATTQQTFSTPWIYIANPFRKTPSRVLEGGIKPEEEGPPGEDSDWAQFVVLANNLLEELTGIRHDIEKKNAGQTQAQITRAVNVQKDMIVRKILDTAVELHCTSGKWMIFCQSNEVNAVWAVVAHATAENDLGIAAKVAPDSDDGRDRLICIYTKDFNDIEDVTRVIRKMKDLGLVDCRGRPLYYKSDAYTYLGLNANNQYNIKVSLYNSADILAGNVTKPKAQNKLEGFLYNKKENSGDLDQMDWE